MTRFSIKMKFLYHETIFFIYENKRIKEDKKISYIIICVMMIIEKKLSKERFVLYQC